MCVPLETVVCPECTTRDSCQACAAAIKVVDYEMAAVESASKTMEMVRKLHMNTNMIERLEHIVSSRLPKTVRDLQSIQSGRRVLQKR